MPETEPLLRLHRPPEVNPEILSAVVAGIDIVWGIKFNKPSHFSHTVIDEGLAVRLNSGSIDERLEKYCRAAPRIAVILCAELFNSKGIKIAGYAEGIGLLSYYGSGIAQININNDPTYLTTTAAHEVAHCFGIVADEAPNVDNGLSKHNCIHEACIMSARSAGQHSFCDECITALKANKVVD